jgi:hypothetical protein
MSTVRFSQPVPISSRAKGWRAGRRKADVSSEVRFMFGTSCSWAAAARDDRYEIIKAFPEIGRHHIEAVGGVFVEPLLRRVGDTLG